MAAKFITPATVEQIASQVRRAVSGPEAQETNRVNIEAIAHAANCEIRTVIFSEQGVSARIQRHPENDTRYLIEVNASDSPQRRRFSVAHEVSHALLHDDDATESFEFVEHRQMLSGYRSADMYKEVQANMLAAALLMPQPLVEAYWRANPDIDDLATEFEVSRDSAYWRVNNLNLLDD